MVKLALLIGENRLQGGTQVGENSVVALKQVLQHPEIGTFNEVRTLDNSQPLVIEQAIEALFSNRQPDDLILLYFSGQSLQDERGKLYLATRATRKDTQGKLIKSTAIPAEFLQDVMNDSCSLNQVIILDCFAEGNASQNGLAQRASVNVQQLSGPGRIILTASASPNDKGSRLFVYTDALVEALSTGAADLNDDGLISLDELHEYTRRKIHSGAIETRIYPPRRNQILLAKVPGSHSRRRQQAAIASSFEQHPDAPILLSSGVGLASRVTPSAATTANAPVSLSAPVAAQTRLLRIAGVTTLLLALTGMVYSLHRQWQDTQLQKTVQALAEQKDYEQCLIQVQKLPERLNRQSIAEDLLRRCQAGATWQHPQVQTIMGHRDWVWSIAVSPHPAGAPRGVWPFAAQLQNHQTLASASRDKTIKLWHLQTGKLLRTLTGHQSDVFSVAIAPNGKTLASGSNDRTIKLWDLQTGELLHTLAGHSHEVWSVAISPDGRTLASGSNDKTIKLWHLQTGKLLRTLTGHESDILAVAFSPDGQTLASGSKDKTIKLWDSQNGRLLQTLSGHTDSLRSVAFSPNGQTLASGGWDKTIRIWQLPTGQLLHTIAAHDRYVNTIAYAPSNDANSPQGQILASGSDDATIKLWNPQTGELLRTLRVHAGHINSLTFVPQNSAVSTNEIQKFSPTLVSGSQDTTIKVVRRN